MQYINNIGELLTNPILCVDTYKVSHHSFEHPEFTSSYGYIEARKGGEFTFVQFFGLQYILKYYMSQQVTMAMIDEAEAELAAHGVPLNRAAWERVVNVHNGYIPVRISAIPEGTIVKQGNVLVIVESTDPLLPGMAAYVETLLLRLHYPTTIATRSMRWHRLIERNLEISGTPEMAEWMMVDFGARGAHSTESAGIGGMAHLVNFCVSDNLMGIRFAKHAYRSEGMPAYGIPATEHSVTTSWGKDAEFDFFKNIIDVHGKDPMSADSRRPISVVIDTYDQDEAVKMWLKPALSGGLLDKLKASNMRLVLRPDSGDPIINVVHLLDLVGSLVGFTVNDKGYRMLPDYVRIIQGDGINEESLRLILQRVVYHMWSADNLVFGSGGGLLVHEAERDTHRFAMKTSEVVIGGSVREVHKEVKTDPSKASKAGRFAVVRRGDTIVTIPKHDRDIGDVNLLEPKWAEGHMINELSFEQVRNNAAFWRNQYAETRR